MIIQNMLMTRSVFSSTFSSPDVKFMRRFQTLFFNPICHLPIQKYGDGSLFVGSRSLQYFSSNKIAQNNSKTKRNLVVYCNLPPGAPLPFGGALPGSWKGWLLGMLFTVAIPLLTNKWGTILKWTSKNKEQIKSTVQTVENIVEAVEDAAEKVEKIAEDIVDDLPEGKLKNAVSYVEKAAEEIAKDAHLVDNIIDKAQEVDEKFEAFIEESNEAAKEEKVKKEI